MIDWWFVIRHAVWIVGASIVLSSWSYHRWLAQASSEDRAEVFRRPSWGLTSGVGALLFCAGMALTGRWWEAIAWSVLGLAAALRLWRAAATRSDAVITSGT